MRILLLGHNGYLGSYLNNSFECDNLDDRNVYDNGKHYDYVINCIGKADLEYCEDNVNETNYSNWKVINDIIDSYPEAKIINFSSYYVYDGDGLNNEEGKTTDKYAYTRQNLEGEKLIKNGVSFRLGKLFGNHHKKQNKLTEHIIDNDHLVLDDVLFNPTSLIQVGKIIEFELKHHILNDVYNLSNHNCCSHYEYGVKINDILGTNKEIKKIDKQKRNFHNYGKFLMDVSKINKLITLDDWESDFIEYIKKI